MAKYIATTVCPQCVNPILKEVVNYYSKLYTSENIDPNEMQCYLNRCEVNVLEEDEAMLCDGEL